MPSMTKTLARRNKRQYHNERDKTSKKKRNSINTTQSH